MNGCEFIRVVTKDGKECFLLTKLDSNGRHGFELTLCHDGKVWTGTVSEDDLKTMSAKVKMDWNQFAKQTLEALTTIGDSKKKFQYQLVQQKDMLEFQWKHIPAEDITFQLGCATLKPREDSAQFITKIFHSCIETMQELKSRIHYLETDNQRLSLERMNALKRLDKCVVAKEEFEKDLYSKFSLILNSKKRKIRELKCQEPSVEEVCVKESKTQSEDTDNSGSDLDEMQENKPNKKKSHTSSILKDKKECDDSLVLDDGLEDAITTVRSRQRGKLQKKQTASKPVLPRVGSSDSTVGSTKKPHLRTSASSTSTKSSENIDMDNLLEEL